MKYKVGDTVMVRHDLDENERYPTESSGGGEYANSDMCGLRGCLVTIRNVLEGSGEYHIDQDDGEWWWSIGMFDPAFITEGDPFDDTKEMESFIKGLQF